MNKSVKRLYSFYMWTTLNIAHFSQLKYWCILYYIIIVAKNHHILCFLSWALPTLAESVLTFDRVPANYRTMTFGSECEGNNVCGITG
jgi:hypothetical protein